MKVIIPIVFFLLSIISSALSAKECPRIISQSPYITHTLEWMGLKNCIVGVSRYSKLSLPHTGGILDPDAEAIDSLMPDLLLTSDWTSEQVLQDVTPKGTKGLRLKGFQSMSQIEDNMRIIGKESGIDADEVVSRFHKQWKAKAKKIDGNGKKVLLISSCSGMPYSFGRKTMLYDLFTQSGFTVVETEDKLRHIRPGKEFSELTQLIDHLKPEYLFIFERTHNSPCKLVTPKLPIQIINLDGEKFLHPAPVILEGMQQLISLKKRWEDS